MNIDSKVSGLFTPYTENKDSFGLRVTGIKQFYNFLSFEKNNGKFVFF